MHSLVLFAVFAITNGISYWRGARDERERERLKYIWKSADGKLTLAASSQDMLDRIVAKYEDVGTFDREIFGEEPQQGEH